jgi:DNA-binding IclR family transcriptional regulator
MAGRATRGSANGSASGPASAGDEAGPSVASRMFAVIDAFTAPTAVQALTLSAIADRAGIPLSTTHRLVAEWIAWGGITRLADGRYSLGMKLWELGVQAPTARNLRTIALPYLEDLYEVAHQHVHLAILDNGEALYLEKLSGHGAVPIISRVGARLPLHATGVGLVLLAHASPTFLDEYLSHPLAQLLPATVTSPGQLRKRLAEIRAIGVARMREEMTAGSSSVAAPILDRAGSVVAAVSIVFPTAVDWDPDQETAVRTAARGISRTLGYRRSV